MKPQSAYWVILFWALAILAGVSNGDQSIESPYTISIYVPSGEQNVDASCSIIVEVQNGSPHRLTIIAPIVMQVVPDKTDGTQIPAQDIIPENALGCRLVLTSYLSTKTAKLSVRSSVFGENYYDVGPGKTFLIKADLPGNLIDIGANHLRAALVVDGKVIAASTVAVVIGVKDAPVATTRPGN